VQISGPSHSFAGMLHVPIQRGFRILQIFAPLQNPWCHLPLPLLDSPMSNAIPLSKQLDLFPRRKSHSHGAQKNLPDLCLQCHAGSFPCRHPAAPEVKRTIILVRFE
jgi:hypothetical protein